MKTSGVLPQSACSMSNTLKIEGFTAYSLAVLGVNSDEVVGS
jgi:hypothetical protein